MKQHKGLTLIELLIVIAIIIVLLLVATFSLNSIREKSRDAKRLSDLHALQQALEVVKTEDGAYDKVGCKVDALVRNCVSDKLAKHLPALENLGDPLGTPSCAVDCQHVCDYALTKLSPEEYQVLFFLEKGVSEFKSPGCYQLTNQGIKKL